MKTQTSNSSVWFVCPKCVADGTATVYDNRDRPFCVTTNELVDAGGYIECELCGTDCVLDEAKNQRTKITEKTVCANCGDTIGVGGVAYIIADETVCSLRCGEHNIHFRCREARADAKMYSLR